MSLTYKESGVDIAKATDFKSKIKKLVRRSFRREVLKDIGGFGSFFRLPKKNYKDPVLVSSSDGIGTKIKIAIMSGKHDTVGIDAVAMNVNDILCTGAEPLFFLDYIAYSRLKGSVLVDIVDGINQGCIESGCSLIGGETAQMPGMYKPGDYDVAGFCVGIVERERIIDGSGIRPKDIVIGIESSGIHSNGYSLVRKALSPAEQKRMSRELLKPTRIYVKPVLKALADFNYKFQVVKGIAHITGGAFFDKIARILPADIDIRIDKQAWPVPAIFRLIQNKGNIAEKEMYHTFNMGIGMVLVVEPKFMKAVMSKLMDFRLKSWVIGEAIRGRKEVQVK